MSQIHLILGGAILFTFGLRVLTMPTEEDSVEEITLEFDNNSSFTNSSEEYPLMPDCYLQKNQSGVITTVNKTRAEVGNDTYLDYEEICILPPSFSISIAALGSLVGK